MKQEEHDKIIEELHKQYPIDQIIKFNEFDIQQKLQENSYLCIQYGELYDKELAQLNHLFELKERLTGQLYDQFRFNDDRNLDKKEIVQYYIPREPKMIKLNDLIARQKARVDFFKLAADNLNGMKWNMKNFIDAERGR